MSEGIVRHLFIKKKTQTTMLASSQIDLHRGYGIEGDRNCDRQSPRQVLIVNKRDLDRLSILPGELKENIVLDKIDSNVFQPGAKLTFDSGAQIRLTFYCEPCQRVSHLVDSLKSIEQKRGILGIVIRAGKVKTSDRVRIEPDYFPALSEVPYERFLELVGKIPYGKVLTYKQILNSIGVDRSYYRVMPIYLKKAPEQYPVHRILDSQGQTISHIHNHQAKLAAEGIKVMVRSSVANSRPHVSLEQYGWQNPNIC